MALLQIDLADPIWRSLGVLVPFVAVPLLISLLFLTFKVVIRKRRDAKLLRLGITSVDSLSGRDFERLLRQLFRHKGYKVHLTPYCGDYGCDLVIERDGVRAVVQAKRASRAVGIRAIQQVVASKAKHDATDSYCVTNSHFTAAARKLGSVNNVVLWERSELRAALISVNSRPGADS